MTNERTTETWKGGTGRRRIKKRAKMMTTRAVMKRRLKRDWTMGNNTGRSKIIPASVGALSMRKRYRCGKDTFTECGISSQLHGNGDSDKKTQ
jgi:hypothetical protein